MEILKKESVKMEKEQTLYDALISYSRTDMYPFHMPGHKRKPISFPNPYTVDITEIDGFDNLHHAEGILKEAEERAAALYGSERCYYLVNGSTCGLLAAICAAAGRGDKVLVARGSHKAVYHALAIQGLSAEYLYPVITANGLQGQITPEQAEAALNEHSDIRAVVITSPTYEGIISDIAGIADCAHAHGVSLIVDEAHGAHLGFGGGFAENAVRLGADAVIMSLHKTLPSFTQTALLHLTSERIAPERVERYLGIFETSSPSYLFMAGMDECVRMVAEEGEQLFLDYRKRLDAFYRETEDLKYLHVMRREDLTAEETYGWDDSKLVIFAGQPGKISITNVKHGVGSSIYAGAGTALHERLLHDYHLQMEMVSADYVLGMTSIMDSDEGFHRLSAALHEIDRELAGGAADSQAADLEEPESARAADSQAAGLEEPESAWAAGSGQRAAIPKNARAAGASPRAQGFTAQMYRSNPREMQIYQAMELPYKEVSFAEAAGQMSADYVYLYPPGIPLIVPGEIITEEFLERIRACLRNGLRVEGQANLSAERIKIVYF